MSIVLFQIRKYLLCFCDESFYQQSFFPGRPGNFIDMPDIVFAGDKARCFHQLLIFFQ